MSSATEPHTVVAVVDATVAGAQNVATADSALQSMFVKCGFSKALSTNLALLVLVIIGVVLLLVKVR